MVCPGKIVPSEAGGVSALPDLSQILNAEFHEFTKWLGPTAPVGSVGVVFELAAVKVEIGSRPFTISTFICVSINGSPPTGNPFPGTALLAPLFFGLTSLLISSAGIKVPLAIYEAMDGTSIMASDVPMIVTCCKSLLLCAFKLMIIAISTIER